MTIWCRPDSAMWDWLLAHGAPHAGQAVPGRYGEDWGEIERRHSIADPSGLNNPNPYLDLLAHARRSTNYERYLSDFPNYPKNWTCAYCGGLRMASAHKCEGCGAART